MAHRLLFLLSGLAVGLVGLIAPAEAQSQSGGLPAVDARVRVLEGLTTTLQTQVTTLQALTTTLQTQVTTLKTDNTALQAELLKEIAARTAGDATQTAALAAAQVANLAADEALQSEIDALNASIVGTVHTVSLFSAFLVEGKTGTVARLENVPAGRYLVVAKAVVQNAIHNAEWTCGLFRAGAERFPNDALDISVTTTESGFIDNSGHVVLTAVATLTDPGAFTMQCFTLENGSDLFWLKITAMAVR